MTNINVVAKVAEVRKNSVRAAVAKTSHTKWGQDESAAVIEALVDLLVSDPEVAAEGYDAIRADIGRVINPSAFAQQLEKLPETHPAYIKRPDRGSRTKSSESDF